MPAAMLSGMGAAAARILGLVVLVTGSAEFLAERVVADARKALVHDDAGADVTDVAATTLDLGGLAELTGPSLFASSRGVVIRGIDALPEAMHEPLVGYVASPEPDIAMVLLHPGGTRGRGLLDKLRGAGVREVKVEAPKPWQVQAWVVTEGRRLGVRVDSDAAATLQRAVGDDVRALSAALEQLNRDQPGGHIDADLVGRYYEGHAEIRSFDIAERAMVGDRAGALELLRWALAQRVNLPLVTAAFATTLRRVVKLSFASADPNRPADLAREVGCSPGQLKWVRKSAAGWDAAGLAAAVDAVAVADAEVKGASADPGHAVEAMVLAVVAARG